MSKEIDLRLGDFTDPVDGLASLGEKSVDCLIVDAPYSERTHSGQVQNERGTEIDYAHITPVQAFHYGAICARATRGWCLSLTDHVLFEHWQAGFGRYGFAPVPCVIRGMTVRLSGDGPSSWTVWLAVNRPRGLIDGTRRGAYVGPKEEMEIAGGKPLWLMEQLILDYTQPGDLVCDPCAGMGTTLLAAKRLGRRGIGWERDADTYARALERLSGTKPLPAGYYNDNQGSLAL